jgi:GNAT superfamily N-acetyltransferase
MRISSLGWRTDVSLRQREGAQIEEHDDHLVIRTASNPAYRWGNFLLFHSPPGQRDAERWVRRFERAFPAAQYLALGIDSPSGELGAADELSAAGLAANVDTVLTAASLRAPRRVATGVEFRPTEGDDDWRKALELRVLTADTATPAYRQFVEREMAAIRNVCEQGHGAWFAAARDGELQASLGVFDASPGTARFQSVDTHPEHRRQGLASNLLYAAGEWARTELRATTLVIAADPNYFAIDIYRSLGFTEHDHKVSLSRA